MNGNQYVDSNSIRRVSIYVLWLRYSFVSVIVVLDVIGPRLESGH